ncbi:MAG: ATP/GTP-binding protein [Chloroflexota bacterium]
MHNNVRENHEEVVMLIRFTVENFRSFDQEVVFSMLPGRAQKHSDHIVAGKDHGIDVLRTGLLYGANASGKSNLVRAMAFARDFIIEGTRPKQAIPVEPFRLKPARTSEPSRFEFEFMVDQQAFAYGFVADRQFVHEEWLYEVTSKNERPLFERTTNTNGITQATFGSPLLKEADTQFLAFVARGTRPNQLFLTKAAENNVTFVSNVYSWFHKSLTIIFPDTQYQGIQVDVHKDQRFTQALSAFLKTMNTGIDAVCTNPADYETIEPLKLIVAELETPSQDEESGEGENKLVVVDGPPGHRYLLHRNEEGFFEAYSLGTRRRVNGETIDFDLFDESDGTLRLFDLFPILHGARKRVFVIDELERSLHPNLVRRFIQHFLASDTNNQLIVTTHESTLLDLDLLRRDEIWFVEKAPNGASTLYSLEEFKPRHDLDIRKGYLHGRFGAIPVFGSNLLEEVDEKVAV